MAEKAQVRRLNHGLPGWAFLGADQDKGFGDVMDALITLANELRGAGGDRLLSAAGLAIGTDKHKVAVANNIYYIRDGSMKMIAAAEVAFTATTHDITVHATLVKAAIYAITISDSDAFTITKGTTATTGSEVAPTTPAGHVLLGYVTLAVAAGAVSFDATTDELDEAHITDTYADTTPAPQVSSAVSAAAVTELA